MKDTDFASVRSELEGRRSEQRRVARRSIWLAVGGTTALFFVMFLLDAVFSGFDNPDRMQALFGAAILLTIVWAGPLLFEASVATDATKTATWQLEALASEIQRTESAMDLVHSGQRFVLFLRSFRAETTGLSLDARRRSEIVEGMAARRAQRHNEWHESDLWHIRANVKWTSQLNLLKAIRARHPIILLGNTGLGSEMRTELGTLDILELTIQAQDWWSVFLTLTNGAYLIFVYVEEVSPMLLREMQHLKSTGLRYVICANDAEINDIAKVPELGNDFITAAVGRLSPDDGASIPIIFEQFETAHQVV